MTTITSREEEKVLAVLEAQHHILLEQLLGRLPELTWNRVFTIVDELNRRGSIRLNRRGFDYELRVSRPASRYMPSTHDHRLNHRVSHFRPGQETAQLTLESQTIYNG